MSNSDVTFTNTPSSSSSDCATQSPTVASTIITLNQLPTLTRNQKVNVTGVLTIGQKEPKQVTKRNGENGMVKEDCVIEDASGNAMIHIWDELINKLHPELQGFQFKKSKCQKLLGQHYVGDNSIHNI